MGSQNAPLATPWKKPISTGNSSDKYFSTLIIHFEMLKNSSNISLLWSFSELGNLICLQPRAWCWKPFLLPIHGPSSETLGKGVPGPICHALCKRRSRVWNSTADSNTATFLQQNLNVNGKKDKWTLHRASYRVRSCFTADESGKIAGFYIIAFEVLDIWWGILSQKRDSVNSPSILYVFSPLFLWAFLFWKYNIEEAEHKP